MDCLSGEIWQPLLSRILTDIQTLPGNVLLEQLIKIQANLVKGIWLLLAERPGGRGSSGLATEYHMNIV
jgi:hypothetical protein